MTMFVGAQYLMAYALIQKIRHGENAVAIANLRDTRWKIQDKLNSTNVDAVVLDNFEEALYEWRDYFSCVEVNGTNYIKCARFIGIGDLESRFVGYLPMDVLSVIHAEFDG